MTKYVKLKELCLKITDGEHGSVIDDPNGKYYLLSNKNIFNNGILINVNDRKINVESYNKINKRITLEKGDVVISSVGTIGKVVVIEDEKINYVFQRSVGIIKVDKTKLNPYFLKYQLETSEFQRRLNNLSKGAVQKCLFIGDLENLLINVPNINTQNKIASILKNLDDKIKLNNIYIKTTQDLITKIYNYWFMQFEFPNDDNKPYKSNKGKLVYNEFLKKEIPINWSIRLLKDCVSSDKYAIVDGPFGTQLKIEEYVSEGIPIFEMEQLNGGLIVEPNKHYITMEKYNTIKRSTVKTGDIIISKTGTLGLLGIVDKNCDKGIIVSRLAKISPDNNKIGQYTLLTILKQLEKNGYWDKKSTGSTMPILNNKILENVEILYPDNNLFVKFENKIKNLYKLIFKCQRENINLEKNRKKILPLLMNNQIKIEDI